MENIQKISLRYILEQAVKALKTGDYLSLENKNIHSDNTLSISIIKRKATLKLNKVIERTYLITIVDITNQNSKYE